jgi:hypothetical protein
MNMKKIMFIMALLPLTLLIRGQGLEDFTNYPETSNAYHDGTFIGNDGSTWQYFQCRGDSVIVAPSPTLGKNRTPTAEVISGTLHNGCGTLSFQFKQVFSTNVNLDVMVNGLVYYTATTNSEQGIVKNSGNITVNISGDFTLDLKQHDNNAGQVCIDNITWTAYSGTILPEPSNYPTAFIAVPSSFTITLTWTDALGTQPPTAYLIKGSTQNNITAPVDGVPVPDDPNLADGSGVLNIFQGAQTCAFSNLNSNTPYYFKIFPYTNTGIDINYKTDGTPPSASGITPNTVIINSENFDDLTFGDWMTFNVLGDSVWRIDGIHGVNGTGCARMTGYAGAPYANDDWLISPSLNFSNYVNENLTFMTAMKYAGPVLKVLISNEYDGQSDPSTFTWTLLSATLSPGNWVWTPSGIVNVSGIQGDEVYIAFRYTSTITEASTWEVDNIVVMGDFGTGINPKPAFTEIKVVPNPSNGWFTILLNQPGSKEISICSLTGNEVYRNTTDQSSLQMHLTGMPKGFYLIRIQCTDTKETIIKKLILN